MEKSFMEQVAEKLSATKGEAYTASNGITLFIGGDKEVWYLTSDRVPFNIKMIQIAREEFLFGKEN